LIADDEPIALRGLERLVAAERGVEVVTTCENGETALAEIRARRPDVALLDVAMPGLSGLDVVRALDRSERPLIVFVTAFDRYAIEAFDVHAVDYLLKPFDEERFRTAFHRVRERAEGARAQEMSAQLDGLLDTLSKRRADADRLSVKDGDRIVLVPIADIA